MKQKSKYTLIGAIFLILILVLTYSVCFYRVNKKYPQTKTRIYTANEPVRENGIEYTVLGSRFYTNKELRSLPHFPKESYENGEKLITVEVKVKNVSDKPIEMEGDLLRMESVAWGNGVDMGARQYFNEADDVGYFEIQPGEERQYVLPYTMIKEMFHKGEWKKAEDREYYLVISVYPERKIIRVL